MRLETEAERSDLATRLLAALEGELTHASSAGGVNVRRVHAARAQLRAQQRSGGQRNPLSQGRAAQRWELVCCAP